MVMTAVVIEPDQVERQRIAGILQGMRLNVLAFEGVADAGPALAECGARLALISYETEGGGLPLASRLRGGIRHDGEGVASILVTNQLCPALDRAARELGALGVLQRPVKASALARIIEAHLIATVSGLVR